MHVNANMVGRICNNSCKCRVGYMTICDMPAETLHYEVAMHL